MKKALSIGLVLLSISLSAQDWEHRHNFAKTYFGVSKYISPSVGFGNFLNTNETVEDFNKSGLVSPAINIGATHFWGHADFYISINTIALNFDNNDIEYNYELGTFTGLRIYPLKSEINSIRPYVGYKFSPFTYRQKDLQGQQYAFTQVKSIFDAGLGIQFPNFYLTVEYGRVINSDFDSYLSRTRFSKDQFPKNLFQIGINYTIETTGTANTEISKLSNELFSKSNKWGLFFAAGPSSVFPIGSSSYITELYPFLDDKSFPIIFPDIAIGYHYTKLDLMAALSFRPINQNRSAFRYEQKISRRSFNLELNKFVGDYHGFAPYIGLGISYENISLSEIDNGLEKPKIKTNKFSPNVTFGWDIRPSVKGDWWILRTNLRYFPFLKLDREGKKLSLQHLEFNFIQFVVYPQRLKKIKSGS